MCAESFMTKGALLAAHQQEKKKKKRGDGLRMQGYVRQWKNGLRVGGIPGAGGEPNVKYISALLLLQIHDGERRQCKRNTVSAPPE